MPKAMEKAIMLKKAPKRPSVRCRGRGSSSPYMPFICSMTPSSMRGLPFSSALPLLILALSGAVTLDRSTSSVNLARREMALSLLANRYVKIVRFCPGIGHGSSMSIVALGRTAPSIVADPYQSL